MNDFTSSFEKNAKQRLFRARCGRLAGFTLWRRKRVAGSLGGK